MIQPFEARISFGEAVFFFSTGLLRSKWTIWPFGRDRPMRQPLAVVILAAGKGKRMNSDLPKVMFPIDGRPSLHYPLEAARALSPQRIVVVVGHEAGTVREAFRYTELEFVLQAEQLGTGHAVLVTRSVLSDFEGTILVLYGDGPLIRWQTLDHLLRTHWNEESDVTLLTCRREDPTGYGRIVLDAAGRLEKIVEENDCDEETRAIRVVNSGIAAYRSADLFRFLERIGNHNAQQEYYLTDLPEIMTGNGRKIGMLNHDDTEELDGFNSLEQYEAVCEAFRVRRGQS